MCVVSNYETKQCTTVEILVLLGVNCRSDTETVHPQFFCNTCYVAASRQHSSLGSKIVEPYLWKEHSESYCQVSSQSVDAMQCRKYTPTHTCRFVSTSTPFRDLDASGLQKRDGPQSMERKCSQTTYTPSPQ